MIQAKNLQLLKRRLEDYSNVDLRFGLLSDLPPGATYEVIREYIEESLSVPHLWRIEMDRMVLIKPNEKAPWGSAYQFVFCSSKTKDIPWDFIEEIGVYFLRICSRFPMVRDAPRRDGRVEAKGWRNASYIMTRTFNGLYDLPPSWASPVTGITKFFDVGKSRSVKTFRPDIQSPPFGDDRPPYTGPNFYLRVTEKNQETLNILEGIEVTMLPCNIFQSAIFYIDRCLEILESLNVPYLVPQQAIALLGIALHGNKLFAINSQKELSDEYALHLPKSKVPVKKTGKGKKKRTEVAALPWIEYCNSIVKRREKPSR